MSLLAGWSRVLARLADHEELVIATPSANLRRTEIAQLIAPFVNPLALRINLSCNPTLATLLELESGRSCWRRNVTAFW